MSTKLKAALIFIAVFLAGAIAGGIVSLRVAKRIVIEKTGDQMMYKRLLDRLDLTPEQKKQATDIYEPLVKRMAESRRDFLIERERCNESIRALLTPEQARKFDEYRANQRERDQLWQRRQREERKRFDDEYRRTTIQPTPPPPPPAPEAPAKTP